MREKMMSFNHTPHGYATCSLLLQRVAFDSSVVAAALAVRTFCAVHHVVMSEELCMTLRIFLMFYLEPM
jgi:hypothetical protein